jgi:hypothetical protein
MRPASADSASATLPPLPGYSQPPGLPG